MTAVSVYDHVRVAGSDPDGIYRVVGVSGERVTLLRVADADGRRVHTGETVTVRAGGDRFEPADNPDQNRSLAAALAAAPGTAYWSVRAFVGQLLANPVQTALALALLVAGVAGGPFLPVPDLLLGGLVFAGGLGLAYAGSGG